MKVFVYFNLHKKLWSIKALEGPNKGRVIGHSEAVSLIDAEFRVGKAGRARVLREGRKNVHAGVAGRLHTAWAVPSEAQRVRYNPYLKGEFFNEATNEGVHKAKAVCLTPTRTVLAW